MTDTPSPAPGEFLLYEAEDGRTRVECRFVDDTLWLSQAGMAELFQTTPQNIKLHLKALYAEGEITLQATCKDDLQVRSEGGRQVQRLVKFYNLDAILATGYRVRAPVVERFRQWAHDRLKKTDVAKAFVSIKSDRVFGIYEPVVTKVECVECDSGISRDSIGRLELLRDELLRIAEQSLDDIYWLKVARNRHIKSIFKASVGRKFEVDFEDEARAKVLISSIGNAVRDISEALGQLRDSNIADNEDLDIFYPGETFWTFGTVIYRMGSRRVLRGSVELRRVEPIVGPITGPVLYYLTTIPGIKEKLARENHGHWGYHYHYVDSAGRRSDTLLTFNRDSKPPLAPTLCWERHAEGDKFKAKARAWGVEKRQSVYSVCCPDTGRFPLSAFKRPAADAEVVWPVS